MKKTFFTLLTVILLASFLRLWLLDENPPGLYPDEAMNGNNALEALHGGLGNFKVFYPENNGREGLFINIQAVFLKILIPIVGGPEPWMLRLPSAIFGIFTVLGVYFLTKELSANYEPRIKNREYKNRDPLPIASDSKNIALLAAFFVATSFWHINFSRIGFRAIMAPAFLTWSLFLLLKSFNLVKNKSQSPNPDFQKKYGDQAQKSSKFLDSDSCFWILPILAGLVYGLGFYSYIAYRATPLLVSAIFFGFLFKSRNERKIWEIIFAFSAAAVIIAAPLIFYFIAHPQDFFGRTAQISVFSSEAPIKSIIINIVKTIGMFDVSGDWNWRHNVAGAPLLFWPVGVLFVTGVITGFARLLKVSDTESQDHIFSFKNRNLFGIWNLEFGILFIWLIVAAIPVVISNEGIPHALRSILMAPAVFILAAFGGQAIHKWFKINNVQRHLVHAFYLLFFVVVFIEAYTKYFIVWANQPEVAGAFSEEYVQIGQMLNSLPREMKKYVIVEASGIDVRGLPMPTQTVMFITDTFSPEKQEEKNIHYLLPGKRNEITAGAFITTLK